MLDLLEDALNKSHQHAAQWGDHQAIVSIIAQLNYLIELETGAINDRSRIPDINIGLLAVREIETRGDMDLATVIYSIDEKIGW